jgi:phage FluMu protein Com
MSQYTTMWVNCPNCGTRTEIETEDTPGEISSNAGFILRCNHCEKPFAVRVMGNIKESVPRGASVLETYYYDVEGSHERALAKYGLASG